MSEELEKLRGDKKLSLRTMLKRAWPYFKPEIGYIILAFLIIVLNVIFDAVLPLIIEHFVNFINQDAATIVHAGFIPIVSFAIGYLVLCLGNQLFLYIESMILQKAGQRVVYRVRMEVFEHIEAMSLDQLSEMPVGSLVTRVANYTQAMSDLFTSTLVALLRNALTVMVVYAIMVYLSWKLALILLGFVTFVVAASIVFTKVSGALFRKERAQLSDFNAYLNESLSGMKITQLFNQEKHKQDDFEKRNKGLWKTRYTLIMTFGIYRPIINLILYLSLVVIFLFGVQVSLSAGTIVAFYLYIERFYNPIQEIADQTRRVQRALTACERLFNLLDVKPSSTDIMDAKEIERFNGKIEFRNVWFAYEGENWVLKDVNFIINPGDTCAFVGATGAGKTTILSLIVRNYSPQKGQIFIDDIDIATIKVESLRRAIGQMLQDVFLFSGNIRDNVTLFDEQFSDEQVNEAVEYVNADKFINKLDKKLDYAVVERGENFSQGQRQLLSFARTIIHKPQILVLDEATANIDTETEVLIQDSLEKMKSIGTMLVVAHRLSTIQKADLIICLQSGKIVESGNHQSLLKNKGYYYNLYKLQFKE